jgi:N-acetylmuramoyl-L-alanine amidase
VYTLKNSVIVSELYDFPFVKIARENSRLIYNLGAPRLGGPVISELGPGPVLKVNGKFGENYRVRLSGSETGFINQNEVKIMPSGTVKPSYYITSMSCGPVKDGDILTIPYPEPVPYEVYPDPNQNRIVITLFGVETSSTWITHLTGRKIIEKVTWEQTTPETYKIYVNLKTACIWGYSFRCDGKRLVLRIKDRPVYDLSNVKPLTGLKIAIEAGHGGSGLGAIGLSGLPEKDVNLDLSLRLGELLGSMGAEVVQARDSDKEMSLIEKRNIVVSSGADLFVSIHANAGGGGYLRVAGTSTYYNNPFWAPLAENIYDRLLELKLKEFGVVGSFNYTPIRLSEMPSILVEQAFMSNAEDEEKLADPQFRQQMAQKISEGITDYLKSMKQ